MITGLGRDPWVRVVDYGPHFEAADSLELEKASTVSSVLDCFVVLGIADLELSKYGR